MPVMPELFPENYKPENNTGFEHGVKHLGHVGSLNAPTVLNLLFLGLVGLFFGFMVSLRRPRRNSFSKSAAMTGGLCPKP